MLASPTAVPRSLYWKCSLFPVAYESMSTLHRSSTLLLCFTHMWIQNKYRISIHLIESLNTRSQRNQELLTSRISRLSALLLARIHRLDGFHVLAKLRPLILSVILAW